MNKQEVKKKSGDGMLALKLIAVVALAFFAALMFRRSAGILAMTPAAFLLCIAAAFIDINRFAKAAIFVLTVFSVNTVEQSDIRVTAVYVALCLLAVLVFDAAAAFIRKGKKTGFAVAAGGLVVCIALSVIFVGNPFSAAKADSIIREYTDEKYPRNENAALGEFKFSDIYYNFETRTYAIDAVSSEYPTEGAAIALNGDVVSDGFKSIMENKISEPYVLEFTEFLRSRFPNNSFSVKCDGIVSFPDEAILASKEGELRGDIIFEVTVGGVQSATGMLECVDEYMNVIDRAGFEYTRIIFKSGIGQWYKRSITVDGNRPDLPAVYRLERVHAGTSNLFNRYVSELISID